MKNDKSDFYLFVLGLTFIILTVAKGGRLTIILPIILGGRSVGGFVKVSKDDITVAQFFVRSFIKLFIYDSSVQARDRSYFST